MLPPNKDSGVHLFTLLKQWGDEKIRFNKICQRWMTFGEYCSDRENYSSWDNVYGNFRRDMECWGAQMKAEIESGGYYDKGVFTELKSTEDPGARIF